MGKGGEDFTQIQSFPHDADEDDETENKKRTKKLCLCVSFIVH